MLGHEQPGPASRSQAAKTVSRGAWKVRESSTAEGSAPGAALFASVTMTSLALAGFQVIAQAVQALFPFPPLASDPLLGQAERFAFYGAGPHPTDLVR